MILAYFWQNGVFRQILTFWNKIRYQSIKLTYTQNFKCFDIGGLEIFSG